MCFVAVVGEPNVNRGLELDEVDRAFNDGIRMFVVGPGERSDGHYLRQLSSDPKVSHRH